MPLPLAPAAHMAKPLVSPKLEVSLVFRGLPCARLAPESGQECVHRWHMFFPVPNPHEAFLHWDKTRGCWENTLQTLIIHRPGVQVYSLKQC